MYRTNLLSQLHRICCRCCLHLVLLCNSFIKFMNMQISDLTWLFCEKVSRHLKFCVWSMFRYWIIVDFMDLYDAINFLFSLIFRKQSRKFCLIIKSQIWIVCIANGWEYISSDNCYLLFLRNRIVYFLDVI